MKSKKQAKFMKLAQKICLVLLFLAAFSLFEAILREKLTFAVTTFDNAITGREVTAPEDPGQEIAQIKSQPKPEKSHAPEPSTLFLFLSGVTGMFVRFARRRFEEFKRMSDIALSIAGLVIISPILIFAAILIKINSKGPIIYKQSRVGKNGRIFKIYKLRTMRQDAEKGIGAVWAQENDPRVTSVGRVLRKAHIDEIPQLLNVLKGEMSIVGPRPERPELARDLKTIICDYEKRLQVKPGITGLAQVWHKYDETIEDVKKKIKYDLLYIRRMCLWVDLRVIAQTFVVVLTGRGAR